MTITKKSTVDPIIESMYICIEEKDYYGCIALLHKKILTKKTKFPILEYVTHELFRRIPEPCQIPFCDKVTQLNEMSSSVVTGTALQIRLDKHIEESITKSIEYIRHGNQWYHCDHISERVLGFALLNYPKVILPVLPSFLKENDKWMVRMVGVAGHYAVKKGLEKVYVEELFTLLIDNA
ncbi:MAG: DNA alkylation repair protein, partial [Pyrinomonadaceae bacterium]|nr:DNA alkylation repair protein [Pyrinomonadaceae bacterium]